MEKEKGTQLLILRWKNYLRVPFENKPIVSLENLRSAVRNDWVSFKAAVMTARMAFPKSLTFANRKDRSTTRFEYRMKKEKEPDVDSDRATISSFLLCIHIQKYPLI